MRYASGKTSARLENGKETPFLGITPLLGGAFCSEIGGFAVSASISTVVCCAAALQHSSPRKLYGTRRNNSFLNFVPRHGGCQAVYLFVDFPVVKK